MCDRAGFIFISSQQAVTPFHFDPEFNFLLQVRGNKTVHMWDPNDHAVLPQAAIDQFYAGAGGNRDQPYREEFLSSAWVLPLSHGQGLHFPQHAAHWVKTESSVSISFSITFQSQRSKYLAMVHAANAQIRDRLGVKAPTPGTSRIWDTSAHVGYRASRKSLHLLDRAKRLMTR